MTNIITQELKLISLFQKFISLNVAFRGIENGRYIPFYSYKVHLNLLSQNTLFILRMSSLHNGANNIYIT